MDPKRLETMRRQAVAAIETSRGDGFAQKVVELVDHVAGLNQLSEQAVEPEPVEEPEPKPKGRARGNVPESY